MRGAAFTVVLSGKYQQLYNGAETDMKGVIWLIGVIGLSASGFSHHYIWKRREKPPCWIEFQQKGNGHRKNVTIFPSDIRVDWDKDIQMAEDCIFSFSFLGEYSLNDQKEWTWEAKKTVRINLKAEECKTFVNRGLTCMQLGIIIGIPLGALLIARIAIDVAYKRFALKKLAQQLEDQDMQMAREISQTPTTNTARVSRTTVIYKETQL